MAVVMENHLLPIALSAAVPLHIFQLIDKNGPDDVDLSGLKEVSNLLCEKGDRLLFGKAKGDKDGVVADIFNKTARAIAVLSFCFGGVKVFGQRYDASRFMSKKKIFKVDLSPYVRSTIQEEKKKLKKIDLFK